MEDFRESDGELDAVLRRLDPVRSVSLDHDRLAQLARSAERTGRPSRRRWGALWIGLGCAALAGLGISAPAIADGIQRWAQTGEYGPVTSETDTTEWIDSAGDDFDEYATGLFPEWLPLPDGFSPDQFTRAVVNQLQESEGVTQVTGLEHSFEHNARCMWIDEWLSATDASDSDRADAAASVLADSTAWPSSVAVAGGGYLEHLQAVAAAARADDRGVLEYEVESDCRDLPEELRQ